MCPKRLTVWYVQSKSKLIATTLWLAIWLASLSRPWLHKSGGVLIAHSMPTLNGGKAWEQCCYLTSWHCHSSVAEHWLHKSGGVLGSIPGGYPMSYHLFAEGPTEVWQVSGFCVALEEVWWWDWSTCNCHLLNTKRFATVALLLVMILTGKVHVPSVTQHPSIMCPRRLTVWYAQLKSKLIAPLIWLAD